MGSWMSAETPREDVKEEELDVHPSDLSPGPGTPDSSLSSDEGQSPHAWMSAIRSYIQPGAPRPRPETPDSGLSSESDDFSDFDEGQSSHTRRSTKKDSKKTIRRFFWWMLAMTLCEANKETISPLDLRPRPGTPDSGLSFKSNSSKNFTIYFKEGQPFPLLRPAETLCEDMKEEEEEVHLFSWSPGPVSNASSVSIDVDYLYDDFSDFDEGQSSHTPGPVSNASSVSIDSDYLNNDLSDFDEGQSSHTPGPVSNASSLFIDSDDDDLYG